MSGIPVATPPAALEQQLYGMALQALPEHIAVVDLQGKIVMVNTAWLRFGALNCTGDSSRLAIGSNYLEVCKSAAASDPDAVRALNGLAAVLNGSLPRFTMEYRCDSPQEPHWYLMNVVALDDAIPSGAVISHLEITAQKESDLSRRTSEGLYQAIFENAAIGLVEFAADGRCVRANHKMAQITGFSIEELVGASYTALVHPLDQDAERARLEVIRSGAAENYSIEKRLVRKDGSPIWVRASVSCIGACEGVPQYFVTAIQDISESIRIQNRHRALLQELAHRGKNLLAVIQSIAHNSLSGEGSLDEAREALLGRIQALASSYDALTNESFEGALLETIIGRELDMFGSRVTFDGPKIMLTVKAAQSFALVTHELATNAIKYGALSLPGGSLSIHWFTREDARGSRLIFEWSEHGGPAARRPSSHGFGTTLLTEVAAVEFECTPQLVYGDAGFRYRLDAPLSRLGAVMQESSVRRRLKSAVSRSLYDTWSRQRGPGGELPSLAEFDWTKFAATGALTIASHDTNGDVHFIQIGHALTERLGRPFEEPVARDSPELVEAYRRCALSGEPCHEYLRFDFGDGDLLTFERLIVPFSTGSQPRVTHVVGIAIYDGHTQPGASAHLPVQLPAP